MRARIRGLAGLAAGAALVVFALFVVREPLLRSAIEWTTRRALPDPAPLHDGALHVVFCGTGLPSRDPAGRSACSAVMAGGELALVDIGGGAFQYLTSLRAPVRQLSTILITHLHSDHIGGIGDALTLSAFQGRERPVTIYGPPGIRRVVAGFVDAYAIDTQLRSDPDGGFVDPRHVVPSVEVVEIEGDASRLLYAREGLEVRAFGVDHWPVEGALGYRFDFAGRSVVFSGDTRTDDRLASHARAADVLVHSAMGLGWIAKHAVPYLDSLGERRDARLLEEAQRIFSPPVEIAEIARRAGVAQLVFSHKPPVPWPGDFIYLWGVAEVFGGDVSIARDGMRIDLEGQAAPGR